MYYNNLVEEPKLKLGHGNLWGVVSQERNHQTLQREDGCKDQSKPKLKILNFFFPHHLLCFTHHDCPLPILCLKEDKGVGRVEYLVVHLLHFSGETMQEGPAWLGHTCCL